MCKTQDRIWFISRFLHNFTYFSDLYVNSFFSKYSESRLNVLTGECYPLLYVITFQDPVY